MAPETIRVCTIVARNYLAQAEVLATSFRQHHPDIEFVTLVIDGEESDRDRPSVGRVMLTDELGLDIAVRHSMSVLYDVIEYSTALKPALLMALLREGATTVAYVDPDIQFFAQIADIFAQAAEHSIVLTPHVLTPHPRDGKDHAETVIMRSGIFNLGFIAVGGGAMRFLNWWHERLQTDAIVDLEAGLFADQRWIDWVPSLFPYVQNSDPGLNVAYWNLHERTLTVRDGVWFVNGQPLRFMHFSGYDPELPWMLSKHPGANPRVLLSEHPEARELADAYGAELIRAGHPTLRRNPYGLAFLQNELPLTPLLRAIYRLCVLGLVPSATPMPDARADADGFVEWLHDAAGLEFSPFEEGLRQVRPDILTEFPDLETIDADRYRMWLDFDPVALELSKEAGGPAPVVAAPVARSRFGWNVWAASNAPIGSRLADLVGLAGIPVSSSTSARYKNSIVCADASRIGDELRRPRVASLTGKVIAVVTWEDALPPGNLDDALAPADEVWALSETTRALVQAATSKAVRRVPLPAETDVASISDLVRPVELPHGRFLFATWCDFDSDVDRQNPEGVISAYLHEFDPDEATLVILTDGAARAVFESERVKRAAENRPDILFVPVAARGSESVSTRRRALIGAADCFMSLATSVGYPFDVEDALVSLTPLAVSSAAGNLELVDPGSSAIVASAASASVALRAAFTGAGDPRLARTNFEARYSVEDSLAIVAPALLALAPAKTSVRAKAREEAPPSAKSSPRKDA